MYSIHTAVDGGNFSEMADTWKCVVAHRTVHRQCGEATVITNKHPRPVQNSRKKAIKVEIVEWQIAEIWIESAFKLNFIFQFSFECLGCRVKRIRALFTGFLIWLSLLEKFPLLINYYIKSDVLFCFSSFVLLLPGYYPKTQQQKPEKWQSYSTFIPMKCLQNWNREPEKRTLVKIVNCRKNCHFFTAVTHVGEKMSIELHELICLRVFNALPSDTWKF